MNDRINLQLILEDGIIKDNQGRALLTMGDNGKIAVGRFPDLNKEYKEYIIDVYKEVTDCSDKEIDDLISFLDFKEDEDEFCV